MFQKLYVLLFYSLKWSVQNIVVQYREFQMIDTVKWHFEEWCLWFFQPGEMNNKCRKTMCMEKMNRRFGVPVLGKLVIPQLYFCVVLCVACFIICVWETLCETLQIYKFTCRKYKLEHLQFKFSFCQVLKLRNFCDFNVTYTCICRYLICNLIWINLHF